MYSSPKHKIKLFLSIFYITTFYSPIINNEIIVLFIYLSQIDTL